MSMNLNDKYVFELNLMERVASNCLITAHDVKTGELVSKLELKGNRIKLTPRHLVCYDTSRALLYFYEMGAPRFRFVGKRYLDELGKNFLSHSDDHSDLLTFCDRADYAHFF